MKYRFILFIFALLCARPVHAQLVINNASDLNFGTIAFDTNYSGNLRLGTNGNLEVQGTGMVSFDDTQSGHIIITSPDTGLAELKCDASGQMSASGATTLTVEDIEVTIDTRQTFGNGSLCQGVTGTSPVALLIDLAASQDPDIYIGGRINIPTNATLPSGSAYSTSSGGGQPITLSITLQ